MRCDNKHNPDAFKDITQSNKSWKFNYVFRSFLEFQLTENVCHVIVICTKHIIHTNQDLYFNTSLITSNVFVVINSLSRFPLPILTCYRTYKPIYYNIKYNCRIIFELNKTVQFERQNDLIKAIDYQFIQLMPQSAITEVVCIDKWFFFTH